MALIAQEGLAAGHGFEDTAFAFFAEVVFDAAMTGDEAHDAFGQVDVEVVTDDAPTHCWRGGAYKAIEEGGDQGLRAVAPIFEFAPLDLARPHGQTGGRPLERLNAGHLVDRHRAHRWRVLQGTPIDRADIGAFGLEFRVRPGRQPRAQQMGLEIGFFLKSAPPGGVKCGPQGPALPPRGQDHRHSSGSAEGHGLPAARRPGR